ncbi:carotenoid oxygenase family protein [Streptomyces sp. NPDC002172]
MRPAPLHPGTGELLVLDARELAVQAVVELPYPVPAGFHGSWLPEPSGPGHDAAQARPASSAGSGSGPRTRTTSPRRRTPP